MSKPTTTYVHLSTLINAVKAMRKAKLKVDIATADYAKFEASFMEVRKKASPETLCKLMDEVGFV